MIKLIAPLCLVVLFYAWKVLDVTYLRLDADNRMLRFGAGKNKGNRFIRVDLWYFGIRLTETKGKENED